MKIAFPFEKAVNADKESNSTLVMDEPRPARLSHHLDLEPGLTVLDCSGGAFKVEDDSGFTVSATPAACNLADTASCAREKKLRR
eukprot:CAMPEP_0194386020 /NCGR_PEP_ID=MMETSP0174-20130528/83856_1 /TAXON_ID=216777 /ORGANISM="Proboscia alata, Strain PI-D3" /LENGTH=84 /DNA_ID=CAMNT_0039174747 /DNA_START=25 /DNA_END=276 /DNA_ORIENTATION=+